MNRTMTCTIRTLLAAVLSAGVLEAGAAEYGVGVSYNNGTAVMFPIKTGSLLIEPEFFYTNQSGGTSFKSSSVGSGVYLLRNLGPLFESYLGVRVFLTSSKSTSTFGDNKSNSYSLAPTYGIQHYFSKQFSLGVDVALEYRSGKQTQPFTPDQDFHGTASVSRIILRAYF
jgi:hypothetical protein